MSGQAGCRSKANELHQKRRRNARVSVAFVLTTANAVVPPNKAAAPERFAPRLRGFGYWGLIGLVRSLADDCAAPAIISFI